MGVRHPAAPLGLISVAAMLPGSWTAHLVDCNTASITDEDFAWAELRAECVATGRHAAEHPKVQTENDDPSADITPALTRARKVNFCHRRLWAGAPPDYSSFVVV